MASAGLGVILQTRIVQKLKSGNVKARRQFEFLHSYFSLFPSIYSLLLKTSTHRGLKLNKKAISEILLR